MRSCWAAGSRATGASRTECTTSATSPRVKTPRASAPAPDPRSWPSCAAPRSTSIASTDTPTSPAPNAEPAGAPEAPTPASPRHDHRSSGQVKALIPDFASPLAGTGATVSYTSLGRLCRPGGVLDDVHEVGALIPRNEALEDIRLDVAERSFRLGGDAFSERLQNVALEIGARVQSGDLGTIGVADVVVSDAEHVVLHTSGDQAHLGFHELRDAGRGVQGNGGPHPADAVLGHAVPLQEAPGLVCTVHLEAPAAATELLIQTQVVEHRSDVQQFRVETEPAVSALQTAEPEDPAGMVVHQV